MKAMQNDLAGLRKGGKPALARALAMIERAPGSSEAINLLDEAFGDVRAHVIGITGPPGVGKSTLINALIKSWRGEGLSVGVVAVDPSSRISGGALLGDRSRMLTDPDDARVFVRSLASRGRLGGLADLAFSAIVLFRAVFDRVIVESVGVGQSEAEIIGVADTVVLCVQPGSGDALQFMKAGIMEIPHIAAVTKADFGATAKRAAADLEGALSLAVSGAWQVPVLSVSAMTGDGIGLLIESLNRHQAALSHDDAIAISRQRQAHDWLQSAILAQFGTKGWALVADDLARADLTQPFQAAGRIIAGLKVIRSSA